MGGEHVQASHPITETADIGLAEIWDQILGGGALNSLFPAWSHMYFIHES